MNKAKFKVPKDFENGGIVFGYQIFSGQEIIEMPLYLKKDLIELGFKEIKEKEGKDGKEKLDTQKP